MAMADVGQDAATPTVESGHRRRSPNVGEVVRQDHFTDDSEAETEILNASQNNTPVKRGLLAKQRKSDWGYSPERRGSAQSHHNIAVHSTHPSDSDSSSDRKRKLSRGETMERNVGEYKRMKATDENSLPSPSLKIRKKPISSAPQEVRDSVTRRRSSSDLQRRKEQTRDRDETSDAEGNDEDRKQTNNRHAPASDARKTEPDFEAAPFTPHLQKPPSSTVHRRSSSFHHPNSSKTDVEARSRTRYSSHDEPSQPPAEHYFVRRKRHSVRSALSPSFLLTMAPRGEKRDKAGRTPLAQACDEGNFEKFNAILSKSSADMEKADYTGNTPLQIASLNGSDEIVKELIYFGANVHCKNSDKDTALIDAVENAHLEVVKLLLKAGVDPRITNRKGKQPLELIPDSEQHDEIKEALTTAVENYKSPVRELEDTKEHDHDAGGTSTDKTLLYVDVRKKENLVMFAAKGDFPGVNHLLDCGMVPSRDSLVAAARGGHHEVLSLLIAFGGEPDPTPKSQNDDTPVLSAIGRGHLEVIELLCNADNVKIDREVPGPRETRFYSSLALSRRGPHYQEEARMLRTAIKKQRRKNGVVEPFSEDEEELVGVPAPQPSAPVEEITAPAPMAVMVEPEVIEAADEAASGAGTPQAEPKRRRLMTGHERAELRAQEEKARKEYLDTMPYALQHLLGTNIPLYDRPTPFDKPLSMFNPLVCIERSEIDPECPEERARDQYLANFQAALFLSHPRLDTAAVELKWETIPMSVEQRAKLTDHNPIALYTLYDNKHWAAATEEQLGAHDFPWTPHDLKFPNLKFRVGLQKASRLAKAKLAALDISQVYWVLLDTFVASVAANERTSDMRLITEIISFPEHYGKRTPGTNRSYVKGELVSERPGLR